MPPGQSRRRRGGRSAPAAAGDRWASLPGPSEDIAQIPVREPLYAFFDREAWPISRNFSELIHASLRFINVARLHRHQANVGGSAQASLNRSNQVQKLDRPLVSDVAKTHGRSGISPLRFAAFRGQGQKASNSLHHIIDEGEIALHAAEVIKLNGAAPHDSINKFKDCHIRPAPGTVDGEKSQSRRRDMKQMAVGVGQNLIALLGRRVETDRKIRRIFFSKRDLVVRPID